MRNPLFLAFLLAVPAVAADAPKKDAYKTDDERSVYTIGFLMGRNVASFGLTPAEVKILQAGVGDAAQGKNATVDVKMQQTKINEMLAKRMTAAAAKEKEKGKAFADKFVKDQQPQAIPEGGWYKEVQAGTGDSPQPTDTVKVHYRGTLIDGTEFDSSYARNEPAEFPLDRVIPCWTRGVAMMKVGGKAKLVCPSDIAYGDQGHPPTIKGGATLLFDVELLAVTKPAPAEMPKDSKKGAKKKS